MAPATGLWLTARTMASIFPGLIVGIGLNRSVSGVFQIGQVPGGERQGSPAACVHMSIRSAMHSASSSSTPRYLTVLSILVWPKRS